MRTLPSHEYHTQPAPSLGVVTYLHSQDHANDCILVTIRRAS